MNINKKLFYGTDKSNAISLLEYGLLVAPAVEVNPEQCTDPTELLVVYKTHGNGYQTGYITESDINAWVSTGEGFNFLSFTGLTRPQWLKLSSIQKLSDLITYHGHENIMGSVAWDGLTNAEVIDRYLDAGVESGLRELTSEFEVRDALGGAIPESYKEALQELHKRGCNCSKELYNEAYQNTMQP